MFVPMDYEQAHDYVRTHRHAKRTVRWDGWDMVFFTPSDSAVKDPKGVRHLDRWGFETRVPVLNNGSWEVPAQYVSKPTRRIRTRSG